MSRTGWAGCWVRNASKESQSYRKTGWEELPARCQFSRVTHHRRLKPNRRSKPDKVTPVPVTQRTTISVLINRTTALINGTQIKRQPLKWSDARKAIHELTKQSTRASALAVGPSVGISQDQHDGRALCEGQRPKGSRRQAFSAHGIRGRLTHENADQPAQAPTGDFLNQPRGAVDLPGPYSQSSRPQLENRQRAAPVRHATPDRHTVTTTRGFFVGDAPRLPA